MTRFILASLVSAAMTAALCAGSTAGGSAPAPSPQIAAATPAAQPPSVAVDCTTVIYGMMDCIDYVTPGSNETKPTQSCCSAIDSVVQLDPFCLCEAIETSAAMNVSLNMTKIFDLPSTCNVSIPDLHNCTGVISPAPAPGPDIPVPESAPAASPAEFSPAEATRPASDGWGPAPTVSAATSVWFGNPSSAIAFAAALIVHL